MLHDHDEPAAASTPTGHLNVAISLRNRLSLASFGARFVAV